MQDHSVVEAIVAGDPDGVAEAYDRYAASVYAYCCSMLAGPEAAEALLDTFIVAAAKLDGLADPGRLEAWLYVVARNDCLRRLEAGTAPADAGPAVPGFADPDDEPPAVTLPVELREKVLRACADNSPAGRALRTSVAHRAGPFGPTGFPKAAAAGPLWWRRVRRHPRVVAAAAVLAVVTMSAGITVIMTAGGAHRAPTSTLALGGVAAGSASGAASGGTGPAPSAAHKTSASPGRPTASTTGPPVTPSADPSTGRGTPARTIRPSPTASSPSPSPSPSPKPSPSPTPSPTKGSLLVAPAKLALVLRNGKPASGTFLLTAVNGPVSAYTIKVPAAVAGRVTVSPAHGSLSAGGFVRVTVTVTGKTALTTELTVKPGRLIVHVVVKL